jgi:hypothetical protein
VFVLIAVVGILLMLLVVTTSVAYLTLPKGRLCPSCGGATSPVVLRMALRALSPWVQWRWCSRCGWEGAGRRGPDLDPLDPPVSYGSGFRWADSESENVPVFDWHPDRSDGPGEPNVSHPSGFTWSTNRQSDPPRHRASTGPKAVEDGPVGGDDRRREHDRRGGHDRRERRPKGPTETPAGSSAGFHFRKATKPAFYPFQWGSNRRRTSGQYSQGHLVKPRPWYLTWLVSREPPGFQWRSGRD